MRKMYYKMIAGVVLFIGTLTVGCAVPKRPLATDYVRTVSHAISREEPTPLKEAIDPFANSHPGQSGFRLVTRGEDSLQLRISMIEAAKKSLDIQYYLIHNDLTGKLILQALLRAADRGVRVRILLDDLNMRSDDPVWGLLNKHRTIEVRVFNPFSTRHESLFSRMVNIVTGITQFNKRMHNKIIISDNQVAITGGRNLGNEYFDASNDFNFRDVDVIAVGPMVAALSVSFDKYWNDDAAFPITALMAVDGHPQAVSELREELLLHWRTESKKGTIVLPLPLVEQIRQETLRLVWAKGELAVDSPSKIDLPREKVQSKPGARLNQIADQTKKEFIIVSPYFVPGEEGERELRELVKRGVKVRILTNSLASTDAVAAHTGYQRYRQVLVEDGVELYEMQPIGTARRSAKRFASASRNSLHSKIYIGDRRDVMIGSFNFDPRSMDLNTEIMLVIHSAELAAQLGTMFDKAIAPESSFHLRVQDGQLTWEGEEDGEKKYYESEPEAGFWRNIKAGLYDLLPIEEHL